jgi:ABC-type antimicrobial peptide transport system permease subunit
MNNYDYNNDRVMEILNNPNYTDEEKKSLFEKYKADLKDLRRKEIVDRLNEYAKNNPIITQEDYINVLKNYDNDDLSKPFEVIESELSKFRTEMDIKYNAYLVRKQEEEAVQAVKEPKVPEIPVEETSEEEDITPDVTPFTSYEPEEETVTPSVSISEEDDNLAPTVFEDKEVKEVMPEELPEASGQKGNASAIIISIIAIIIGIVIMYAIIKLR